MSSPGMIRPAAVHVPTSGNGGDGFGFAGRGGAMPNTQQAQQTGLGFVQNLLSRAAGQQQQTGGAFNWGTSGGGFFEDDGLRELKESYGVDNSSIEYHAERASGAIKTFWDQIHNRHGVFYNLYKQTKEEFKNSGLGQPCPTRTAFIDDVNRSTDFTRVMAANGAPFFGWLVIQTYQLENKDNITPNEYMGFAHTAFRNVFMFEMISWLMKTKNGNRFINNLSVDIQGRISKLSDYKELGVKAFDVLGLNFPYAALEFKVSEISRPDYSMLIAEMGFSGPIHGDPAAINYEKTNRNQENQSVDRLRDLQQFVLNSARRTSHSDETYFNHTPLSEEFKEMNWDQNRTDFVNANPENIKEFNVRGQFIQLAENIYAIEESNWTHLQKFFKKADTMGEEEAVLSNCVRVVNIDLDLNTGWSSTIARGKGLNMTIALTDPKSILPYIEDVTEDSWKTTSIEMDVVVKPGNLQVDVEECTRLAGKGIPVIAFKDNVSGPKDAEIKSCIEIINRSLTSNMKKENAVCFESIHWDTFDCSSIEDFTRICHDLPFLFKDSEEDKLSFFQVCKSLVDYSSEGIVDEEFIRFVDRHLTSIVNNWLINSCGYHADPNNRSHLSVDSVLEDFRALSIHLKENDPESLKGLHAVEDHFLAENAKIFTFNNSFNKSDDDSYITKACRAVQLNVVRPFLTVMLNRRQGPFRPAPNGTILIKRSKFPEYFKMMEDGFKATMKTYKDETGVSKLLHFTESNTTWLFSYSNIDRNVATLRQVSETGPLVLLSLQ